LIGEKIQPSGVNSMHLESPEIQLPKSAETVYTFLSQPDNFGPLMPSNTSKFEVLDEKTFVFALSGMPEIKLRFKEGTPFQEVVLGAASDKLPFELKAHIQQTAAEQSQVKLTFDGDLNPMMAMMIQGPLNSFLKALVENLSKVLG
jgi:carbon monoxide dehydrogenase subunit G